jgi:hypothetical protein
MLSDPKDCSLVNLPLTVDLDETLLRVDSLHESLAACITSQPSAALELGRSLRRGKAAFKRNIAALLQFDPSLLPYNEELLSYLKTQKHADARYRLRGVGVRLAPAGAAAGWNSACPSFDIVHAARPVLM